jgi:hypothetical protein
MLRDVRPSPPCPTDPWVILADAVADAEGTLRLDPIRHRRYVGSFGPYWFSCASAQREERRDPGLKIKVLSRLTGKAAAEVEDLGVEISHVSAMDATSLKGVNRRTALGRLVAGRSIADIAGSSRTSFVNEAREAGVDPERADGLWEAAGGLMQLLRTKT